MKIADIPSRVVNACRKRSLTNDQIEKLSAKELFEQFCVWEGLINWSDTLWDIVTTLQYRELISK